MMDSLLVEDHHKIISIHAKWDGRKVYGKISTNAILTFNFFLIGPRAIWVLLVRLRPWRSFWEGFQLAWVLSWDEIQDVVRLKCGVGLPSAAWRYQYICVSYRMGYYYFIFNKVEKDEYSSEIKYQLYLWFTEFYWQKLKLIW